MKLAPCPACARHVRVEETACPFCARALAPVVPRSSGLTGAPRARAAVVPRSSGLTGAPRSRAAVLFLGAAATVAGCGKERSVDPAPVALDAGPDPVVVAVYGPAPTFTQIAPTPPVPDAGKPKPEK